MERCLTLTQEIVGSTPTRPVLEVYMAKSRKAYWHKVFVDECKYDMKKRRKEYNRKVRHAKVSEDDTDAYLKNLMELYWDTLA